MTTTDLYIWLFHVCCLVICVYCACINNTCHFVVKILSEALLNCHKDSCAAGQPFALEVFIAGRNRLENPGSRALAEAFKVSMKLQWKGVLHLCAFPPEPLIPELDQLVFPWEVGWMLVFTSPNRSGDERIHIWNDWCLINSQCPITDPGISGKLFVLWRKKIPEP